jgi:hypothetical protein
MPLKDRGYYQFTKQKTKAQRDKVMVLGDGAG